MNVRPARLEDREALVALWREVDTLHARIAPGFFREAPDDQHARAEVGRALSAARTERDRALLVAEEGEAVIGFAHAGLYDTPRSPERRSRRRAHLDALVVAAAHRRRGVGRALMAAAAEWCRGRGAEQLLLTVWEGNEEAEGLYRALGYGPVSRVLGVELDSRPR